MDSEKNLRAITRALQQNDTTILSEEQNKLLDYYSAADDAIREHGRHAAVNVIRTKFGCSRSSAYDYITGAEFVFGSRYKFEKAYHKAILIDQYDRLIYAGLRSCLMVIDYEENGVMHRGERVVDDKVYASLMKYMAGKERLLHLDQEDPPFDPKELPVLPMITASPEDVGLSRTALSNQVIELIQKYDPSFLPE